MYKYQLQRNKQEKENTKYMVLDEIIENEIPNVKENKNDHQQQQKVPQLLQVLL